MMDLSELTTLTHKDVSTQLMVACLNEMEDKATDAKGVEDLRQFMVSAKKGCMNERNGHIATIKKVSEDLIKEIKKFQNGGIFNTKKAFDDTIKRIEYRYLELKTQRTEDDLTRKKEALLQKRQELGFDDIEAE